MTHEYFTERKTKHGLDKLQLMIRFISVIEGKQTKEEYALFKLWICSQIKRHLTDSENLKLTEGILRHIQSTEGTNERLASMRYLFDAEFLD